MQVNKYFSKTFYVKYGMLIINEKLHINNHPIQQNNFYQSEGLFPASTCNEVDSQNIYWKNIKMQQRFYFKM